MKKDITYDNFKPLTGMQVKSLRQLLRSKDASGKWFVCTIDEKKCFMKSVGTYPSDILFCFIPNLDDDPYIAKLSTHDLKTQCQQQGFVDESIKQIQQELYIQSLKGSLELNFRKVDCRLETVIALSSAIEVSIEATIVPSDNDIAVIVYRSLLQEILMGSYSLKGLNDRLENLLQIKGRAVDYLKMSVEELGGERIIQKWAPKASTNAKALEKYHRSKECNFLVESLQEQDFDEGKIIQTAQFMFELRKDFTYPEVKADSPRKRPRRPSSTDFLPNHAPMKASKDKSALLESKSCERIEIASSSIKEETPPLASKKGKFRKVKITKS